MANPYAASLMNLQHRKRIDREITEISVEAERPSEATGRASEASERATEAAERATEKPNGAIEEAGRA